MADFKRNSIFEEAWYLDAVAPGKWRRVEVLRNNQVVARWSYVVSKKWGQKVISNPPFCQTTGPWIASSEGKKVAKLAREKELLEELIDALGPGNVDLVLDSKREYILPFRWKGLRFEPTFSYRIEDLSNLDVIYANLRDNIRRDIKKAENKISISEDFNIDILIELQNKTFERQGRRNPIDIEALRRLDKACKEREASKLLVAIDQSNNIHAAGYFVYDNERCYYLFSGADPKFRNSGAGCYIAWKGIELASKVSKIFDFEGSNIEDIEQVFRNFGGDWVVNYRVYRFNFVLSLADYLKPKIKRLLRYKI